MKRLLRLLFTAGIFLTLSTGTTFALSSFNTDVTEMTVGTDPGTIELEFTVDAQNHTFADGDTVTITVPDQLDTWADFTFTAEYDEDTDNDGVNETAITAGGGNGQYALADDDNELVIKWSVTAWDAVVDDASTIRVIITAGATPQAGYDEAEWGFDGSTVADDAPFSPLGGNEGAVDISSPDANISVALSNTTVGETTDATVTYTAPVDLQVDDVLSIVFEPNLVVTDFAYGGHTFDGDGDFDCSALNDYTIQCDVIDDTITAGTGTVVFEDLEIEYALTEEQITYLNIFSDSDDGDRVIGELYEQEDTEAATLSAATVSSSNSQVGGAATHTFSFTTTYAIPNLGNIELTYPAGWDVSGADGETLGDLSGLDGTWTASVSGQVITITQTGGTETEAGAKSFSLEGIENPSSEGNGGDLTLTTQIVETVTHPVSSEDFDYVGDIETSTTVSTAAIQPSTSSSSSGGGGGSISALLKTTSGDDDDDDDDDDDEFKFDDVDGHWAEDYIYDLLDRGIVSENTSFNPDNQISRVELLKLAMAMIGVSANDEVEEGALDDFSDVDEDAWYAPYLAEALDRGIVEGYEDGTFRPNQAITRAEALKILLEASGEFDEDAAESDFSDVDQEEWYAPYVNSAVEDEVVNGYGDGTFGPEKNMTRAEAAKIVSLLLLL